MMTKCVQCTRVFLHLVDDFVSDQKPGWKSMLSLALACCAVGLIFGTILFLGLCLSIASTEVVSFATSVSIGTAISILLFFSKHARCFSILFLISCGMREGRNALITAGTGIVILQNIRNIFQNLEGLANSIACNLEAKRLSIQVAPLGNYIKAIRWIYDQGKQFTSLSSDFVTIKDQFHAQGLVSDEALKLKLNETEQHIQSVAKNISGVLDAVADVAHKLLFVIGIAMVLIGTGLFLRRYLKTDNRKFQKNYVTKGFSKFDAANRQQGKSCVLPLNKSERKEYIMIPSLRLTSKEWKGVGLFLLPVCTNLCIWTFLIAIDAWLYWLILSVRKHLQALPEFKVPFILSNANGIVWHFAEIGSNTHGNSFHIHLFEHECIPTPTFSLDKTWIPLSIIVIALLILGLLSAALTQLKLLVLASFYPSKEMERILYLHAKLLQKRGKPRSKTVKKEISILVKTLHFWFPILKMKGFMNMEEVKHQRGNAVCQ